MKAKILIVEDENNVAGAIRSSLEDFNYEITSIVVSGEDAIKSVKEIRPDLILMDIILESPMKGTEAADKIRVEFDIPIIFLTGYLNKNLLEEAKISEPQGYLLKPFNEKELYASIEIALHKDKMQKCRKQFNSILMLARKISQAINNNLNNSHLLKLLVTEFTSSGLFYGAGIMIPDTSDMAITTTGNGKEEKIFKEICDSYLAKFYAGRNTKPQGTKETSNSENDSIVEKISIENKNIINIKFHSGSGSKVLVSLFYNQKTEFSEDDILLLESIVNDISISLNNSELKKKRDEMSRSLAESEQKYRQVVEHATDIIFTTDISGNFTYVNTAGQKNSGFSEKEIYNLNFAELVLPDYSKRIKKFYFRQYKEKQNSTYLEYPFKTKNGEVKWYGQISNLVFIKNKFIGFHCIARDITERKHVLQQLRNRENEMSTIIDNIPGFAFLKDNKSNYIIANKKLSDFMGYSKEQIIGKSDLELLPETEAKKYIAEDRKVIDTGKPFFVDRELSIANGELLYLDIRKIPLKDEDGNIRGIIGLGFDITQRKHAEEAIRSYSQDLEELNKTKDKFFSIISHDLRSPFQGLLGLSSALVEEFETFSAEEIKLYLTNMNVSAKNLFNLIENLLQWSRIQRGQITISLDRINVYEEVLYTINLIKRNAESKEIIIGNNISQDIYAFSDTHVINSVLQNLLSNAIKFSNRKGEISISSITRGNQVYITVSDDGVGMAEQDIKDLFRIDTHRSSQGTENESGTGLGLIISKELLEMQGGKIMVKSKLKAGSSFTFTLLVDKEH